MALTTQLDEQLRQQFANDLHRPRYHFLPPAQWINDPNGLFFWRGNYHLFYQHNPAEARHADMHWGHAVSSDLVHWRHLPIALAPTPGGPDQDGVYSGCAVAHDGVPTLVYTGVNGDDQLVCLATAVDPDDPDLVHWQNDPGNPVIPAPPPDVAWVAYRDPSVWREADGTWYMVHGAGIVDQGGAALLYRSADLRTWDYLGLLSSGDLTQREPVWTGTMWECPQLFPLGDRHVLLIAVWAQRPPLPNTHYPAYAIGTFSGQQFVPQTWQILDTGSLYAPQTMIDAQGRRLLWGWLRESRPVAAQVAVGWSGALSLPWVLGLDDQARLRITPVPELAALRGAHTRLPAHTLSSGMTGLPVGQGDCLELDLELDPGSATTVGLVLRQAPDNSEYTRLSYTPATGRLAIEREHSSLDDLVARTTRPTTLALTPAEPLRLRVFLDRSIIELFANERVVLTERIYPTRPDALSVSLFAEGGQATCTRFDCWELGAIWPE